MTENSLFKGLQTTQKSYKRSSKLLPEVVRQAWQRRCIEFLTFWKIPGMSRTIPAATDIRAMRSSTEVTSVSCTKLLMWPPKEKVQSRSGWPMNRATTTYPPLSKGYVEMSTNASRVMWRRPVLLYHMQWCNDGGTCAASSSSGRTCCKKFRYTLPSKRLGRRYGPMTQSPNSDSKQWQGNVLEPHVVA